MFRYPFVVLMFILNIFADPPPKVTNYPKSQKLWPELQASFASRVIFGWFDQLILKGYRKSLNVADLWDLCYQDTSVQIVRQFERTWAKYYGEDTEAATSGLYKKFKSYGTLKNTSSVKKKKVTILWPIWGTFWGPIMSAAVIKIIGDIVTFVNPQILKLMIQFVESKEYMWRGFAYAIGIFIFAEMQSIFFHQQLMSMYRVGLNWRTAITFAVYKKSLRISNAARKKYTMGEVVNLMAVDAQRCNDFASFCHFTWTTPFIILAVLYFLWQILGLAALAGLAIMLIIIPINALIGKKVKHLQMEQMTYKDERVKMMNEVLTGIKVLKLYAWDPSFRNQILKIREKEIRVLKSAAMWNASISFLWLCSSFLVSLVTFAVFVIIDERNVLTPEIAFVATALFNIMRTTTSQIPTLVQLLLQFLVSYRRIDEFMNAEELDLNSVSHDESKTWGGTSVANLTKVLVLQKKVIRALVDLNPKDSCREAYKSFGILTLYIHAVIIYTEEVDFPKGRDFHLYRTRRVTDYHLPTHHHMTQYTKKPSYVGRKLFNMLPPTLKDLEGTELKIQLKKWLMERPVYFIKE
ncbi:Canalicular multispecific organic anion transporter 1 [Homalodisca vitripennis]|nr:Canalicular multispecific organic anion transporter 1 [Homalodisca vitripennis]